MFLLTETKYGKSTLPEPQPFLKKKCMLTDMYDKAIMNVL